MVIKEGQSVNLECSNKKSSSPAMYWYLLPRVKNSSWALQQSTDTVVRLGDTVTLECSASAKNFLYMSWYKLPM
ncbi:hypothetical protein EK904_003856 [Melospiza melodia maxima]|nr:hypothetical protein EK904_003856 [Melospiza melodia maxima]